MNAADLDKRALQHFDELTHDEVGQAVADLKAMGFSDHGIAIATRLSVEAVRQLLAERRERQP